MKKTLVTSGIIIVIIIILAGTSLFIVEEGFQAITLRFGKIANIYTDAGLKFKLPWDVVQIYSKKILSWDGKSDRIPTEQSEAQFIYVNTTARWQIIDTLRFYEKLGTRNEALKKLDDIIDSAVRTVISNNLLLEAVRSTRTPLEFSEDDFKNIPALVNMIITGERVESEETSQVSLSADSGLDREEQSDDEVVSNSVSRYLLSNISANTWQQLQNMVNANSATNSQKKIVIDLFNLALDDANFYNANRFEDITLIAHAQSLIKKENKSAEEVRTLNRLLLEAAYPQYINVSPVKKGRLALSREMLSIARASMYEQDPKTGDYLENSSGEYINQFGIKLIDIVIRQIKYSEDLRDSVYKRMITERNQLAEKIRSEGTGAKNEILGQLANEVKQITSKAERESEEIKGRADAEATRIYADAYEKDEEFFEFWRSLESYKTTLPQFSKTLSTDAEYFNYLYDQRGR